MAFVPGFYESKEENQIERFVKNIKTGTEELIPPKVGKDIKIGGTGKYLNCEMMRTSDVGWEAAHVRKALLFV